MMVLILGALVLASPGASERRFYIFVELIFLM